MTTEVQIRNETYASYVEVGKVVLKMGIQSKDGNISNNALQTILQLMEETNAKLALWKNPDHLDQALIKEFEITLNRMKRASEAIKTDKSPIYYLFQACALRDDFPLETKKKEAAREVFQELGLKFPE